MMPRIPAPAACIARAPCFAGTQHVAQVPTLPFFFFCTKRDKIKEKSGFKQNYRFYPDYAELMVKWFFFSCLFLHLFFPFLYSYNFFPFPIFIQFSNLQKWGKMHAPRSCILKDRNCRSHSKTVSHLIWDFVCLNNISVVPLALTIPFVFFPTCWCSGDWTSVPTGLLPEVAIKFHQIWTNILLSWQQMKGEYYWARFDGAQFCARAFPPIVFQDYLYC